MFRLYYEIRSESDNVELRMATVNASYFSNNIVVPEEPPLGQTFSFLSYECATFSLISFHPPDHVVSWCEMNRLASRLLVWLYTFSPDAKQVH